MKKGEFIKCLSKEHGAQIIAYAKSLGISTRGFRGKDVGTYYGLDHASVFTNMYRIDMTTEPIHRYKEIELPKDWRNNPKGYPKEMLVWDNVFPHDKQKQVVHFEAIGKYFTKDESSNCTYIHWDNAAEEIPQKVKVTLDEIAEWKGVDKSLIEIV